MQSNSRPASTSTRPAASPLPRAQPYQVNTQTKVFDTGHGRILCIADIRGRLSALNDLAREVNAVAIIHTGDFGFFESHSLERINDRTLRHLTMYSPLIPSAQRTHLLSPDNPPALIRSTVSISLLSEFPLLLSQQIKLNIPVYTTYGACEDVAVLEKIRSGEIAVENLHVIDEATTRVLDVGGVKLRLLGLGGALVGHKMFDNGEGRATIAGGQGTMWVTALQIGELVDTAQRVFDPSETRVLVTHASPGREGLIAQLALVLKADLTLSAGLHFRYATSYNEFSVQADFEGFRAKIVDGKERFERVWESVRGQVEAVVDEGQRVLLDKALSVVERVPPATGTGGAGAGGAGANPNAPGGPGGNNAPAAEEPAWKNCWNWNLCDAAYGSLVFDVKEGRVSAELKSQGFNYAYRRTATINQTPTSTTSALPANNNTNTNTTNHTNTNPNAAFASNPPTKGSTPIQPSERPLPPHLAARGASNASTPPPPGAQGSRTSTPLNQQAAVNVPQGNNNANANANAGGNANAGPGAGTNPNAAQEKAERERQKKKEKKERKDREKAEREKSGVAVGAASTAASTPGATAVSTPGEAGGESRPASSAAGAVGKHATGASTSSARAAAGADLEDLKSPVTDGGRDGGSGGARTPKGTKPARNPWTIFMRMSVSANEGELKEFFGEAGAGITRIHFPTGSYSGRNQKMAYIEFGDEEAMRAGLDKHAEKLKDTIPEVKQASDRESRADASHHRGGGPGSRGRGGRGGGFVTRGLAAAGLTSSNPNANAKVHGRGEGGAGGQGGAGGDA